MKEVRWGVIGVGDVCEVKSAPALDMVENSRLVAVMRRDASKAEDFARRHNVAKWYNDADDLLNDDEVNAIYVATPPVAHKELTLKAAATGRPVYVEKPMARTHQECLDMISACEAAGVPLYVAYYRRGLPQFLKIKELVGSGAIGDVRYVRIELNQELSPGVVGRVDNNWRVDPAIAGGGYFYDLASHQLDYLDFVLGPIKTATGHVANQAGQYSAEDIVTASFEFESGAMGTGVWCFSTGKVSVRDQITFVGSNGQVSVETFGGGKCTLETDASGVEEFEFELPQHIQELLIRDVVADILGKGSCPSTGITAARTNRVMEAICGASHKSL